MSGLVGVWNLDGRPMDDRTLQRMSAAIGHRGRDGERRVVAGSFGLGHRHFWVTPEEIGERQPLVAASTSMLAMDGRLDNRDELLRALDRASDASDAACALAAYEAWGTDFAARLTGDFAIAVFDVRENRLILARDAIGLRPLYYFQSDRLFAFASEIKALLVHPDVPCRADDEGVADFLLISSRPVDQQHVTCFSGISALVPAHLAVVTRERTRVRRYWDFEGGREVHLASLGEYAEGLRHHFERAIRRRARSAFPVAVSLSGGLDSSAIFCTAETLRRASAPGVANVVGISYTGAEGTDADEQRFLCDIEARYGVEIERFPMQTLLGVTKGTARQIRAIEAPFIDYMWNVTEELHRRAAASGARVLLSGTWGDQMLFSSAYLIDLFCRPAWRLLRRHLSEYGKWLGPDETRVLARRLAVGLVRHLAPVRLLPALKWIRRRISPATRDTRWFSDAFLAQALQHVDRPAVVGRDFRSAQARSIYLEARSKHHVHCMEWNNKIGALHGHDASLPFLDRDLIAFLMAIPGDVQNWEGVPRALMREAMLGILPEPVRRRRWKANFSTAVNTGMMPEAAAISDALSPSCLGVRMGYLDPARLAPEVAGLVRGLARPDCVDSWSLADLFGLEVWLQVFFRDPPDRGALAGAAG